MPKDKVTLDEEITQLQQEQSELENYISLLKKRKEELDKLQYVKAHECCTDVCAIIKHLEKSLENEILLFDKEKSKEIKAAKIISRTFKTDEEDILIRRVIKKINSKESLISERINEIQKLKSALSKNNICDCGNK